MRFPVCALALAALVSPAQASVDRAVPQPPARIFAERPLDTLGASFVQQLAVPRRPPVQRAASLLPEPDGYAILLSGIGLLLFVAYRRRRAAA